MTELVYDRYDINGDGGFDLEEWEDFSMDIWDEEEEGGEGEGGELWFCLGFFMGFLMFMCLGKKN